MTPPERNAPRLFQFDPDYRKDLREPFPPEQILKVPAVVENGRVKRPALDYVSHAAVTERLNHAAPDWCFDIIERIEYVGQDGRRHVSAIVGAMTIGGKTITEAGDVDNQSTYGDELKRAISDFIRRGAMRFGVALDLYAKEDLTSGGPASGAATVEAQPRADTLPPAGAGDRVSPPAEAESPDPVCDCPISPRGRTVHKATCPIRLAQEAMV